MRSLLSVGVVGFLSSVPVVQARDSASLPAAASTVEWSKITGVDGLKPGPTERKDKPASVHRADEDDEEVERAPTLNPKKPATNVASEASTTSTPLTASNHPPLAGDGIVNMPISPGTKAAQVRFTGMKEGAMIEFLAHSAEVSGWGWPGGYMSGTADTWKALCALPCRLNADPDRQFRVSGPKIATSDSFFLPTRGSHFEVAIKPGWDSTRTAAWVMFAVSGVLALAGTAVFVGTPDVAPADTKMTFWTTSGALVGGGLVFALIGGPLMGKSSTSVEIYRE